MNERIASLEEIENHLRDAAEGRYVLKLYVTGSSTVSAKAVANVHSLCEHYLPGRYELTIIDLLQQPELAANVKLLVSPTLVKESPVPSRRIVGDMANEERLLCTLSIAGHPR